MNTATATNWLTISHGAPARGSSTASIVLTASETISRNTNAASRPTDSRRRRSHARSAPAGAARARPTPLQTTPNAVCNCENTALAPTTSRAMPATPARLPNDGRSAAFSTIAATVVRACSPASAPTCATSSACASGVIDAADHSASTSSGASDSAV